MDCPRALRRHLPVGGGVVARVAARVNHEIGFRHSVIGAAAAVEPDHPAEERMVFADRSLGIQRRDNRCLDFFGEAHRGFAGTEDFNAAVCDDHGTRRVLDRGNRPVDGGRIGMRAKRRKARVRLIGGNVELAFKRRHGIAGIARHVDMDGSRRAGRRLAEGLPQQMRNLLERVDTAVELGDRLIQRLVGNFLVGIAILVLRDVAPRDCNDGRMPEIGILHAGRQIRCAHGLGHADSRPSRYAGISVRHVRDRFFRVAQDALDPRRFDLGQRASQDRVHEKHMGHAIGLEHLREEARPRHFLRHRTPPGFSAVEL